MPKAPRSSDPSLQEIKEGCARAREAWSPSEYYKRAGVVLKNSPIPIVQFSLSLMDEDRGLNTVAEIVGECTTPAHNRQEHRREQIVPQTPSTVVEEVQEEEFKAKTIQFGQ